MHDFNSAWQQHDVQELCRVMFDALEKTWKDTDQWNLINELYQGKMRDFIQCSEVIAPLFLGLIKKILTFVFRIYSIMTVNPLITFSLFKL